MGIWCRFFIEATDKPQAQEGVERFLEKVKTLADLCVVEVEWMKPCWKIEKYWDVMTRIHYPSQTDEPTLGRRLTEGLGSNWMGDGIDMVCAANAGDEIFVKGICWINVILHHKDEHTS